MMPVINLTSVFKPRTLVAAARSDGMKANQFKVHPSLSFDVNRMYIPNNHYVSTRIPHTFIHTNPDQPVTAICFSSFSVDHFDPWFNIHNPAQISLSYDAI